jgi:hypothetical protein
MESATEMLRTTSRLDFIIDLPLLSLPAYLLGAQRFKSAPLAVDLYTR